MNWINWVAQFPSRKVYSPFNSVNEEKMMTDKNMIKISSVCAILIAIIYIMIALIYLFLPDEQKAGNEINSDFLISVAQSPQLLIWQIRLFTINAILSVTVVLSLFEYLKANQRGLIAWASVLALIGFSILIYINCFAQVEIPRLANVFVKSDHGTQLSIAAQGFGFDDWMAFGLIGIWMIIINWIGQKNNRLPLLLSVIGIIGGLANFLIAFGTVAKMVSVIMIAAILGGVFLGPVWYIWIGIKLWKEGQKAV